MATPSSPAGNARSSSLRLPAATYSPRVIGSFAIAVIGFLVPSMISSPNTMTVLLDGILLGLSALSVGFLLNLLGWVSFGGAAFSGAAAYLFAILAINSHMSLLLAVVVGVAGATAVSGLIGVIFVRSKALVFTMLTLALGQLLLQVVSLTGLSKYTGAANGLIISYRGTFLGLDANALTNASTFWPVAWAAVIIAVFGCSLLARSRFGQVLRGIRENESRLQHAGYNTYLPKLAAFAVAGLMGACAGALQALNIGFVSPSLLSFSACGTAIIAAIVGGYESPFGPVLGGILMIWGQNEFGSTGQLFLYTGIALVVVLTVFPRGITGLVATCASWLVRTRIRPIGERGADAGD